MKRIIILLGFGFALSALVGCVEESLEEYEEIEKQIATRSDVSGEQHYDELSKLFWKDHQSQDRTGLLYSVQPVSAEPFTHATVLSIARNSSMNKGIEKVLILTNSYVYSQLPMEIERYANDIHSAYGCQVIMEKVSGGDHLNVKNLILSHRTNLNGVVLIGDFPAARFEIYNDHNDPGVYKTWPCDLFYMDLDGVWSDTDGNNFYDAHKGDFYPEIFLGRISTKNMGTLVEEIEGLKLYLDKDHDFWSGVTNVKRKSALTYTDKDWAGHAYFTTDIYPLYGETNSYGKLYGQSGFGRAEYLSLLRDDTYEFIQLACHASNMYLYMSGGGISSSEIFNNGTEAIGYNLFCCSGCDWSTVPANSRNGFLAGSHIYNPKRRALVVVGSTKTGSMLEFYKFYTPLGQGKSIGESLVYWWKTVNFYTEVRKIHWFYGMTIIGDPMINFHYQHDMPSTVTLNGFDVNNPAIYRFATASFRITAINYSIPAGKNVQFNAPTVVLNSGFNCPPESEFIINNL